MRPYNPPFELAPERIERRLRARLTPLELFALLLGFGLTCAFAYLDATGAFTGFPDYRTFIKAADSVFASESGGYFYAHWFIPVLEVFNALPLHVGYVLWGALNLIGMGFAARVFGGNAVYALLSYQMLYVLYYGNIVGIIVAGLALLWWGLHRGWWLAAGLGWFLACTKFQLGVPLGVALIVLAEVPWSQRWRVLIVPTLGTGLSLLLYPDWVSTLLDTAAQLPPDTRGNISLWQYIGALALVVVVPPLVLPLPTGARLAALAAATALASPYFQQTDLLALYMLPMGWLPLLGNFGYLFVAFGWLGLKPLVVIPGVLYAWALTRSRNFRKYLRSAT